MAAPVPRIVNEGTRLPSRILSDSAYGATIPKAWGTMRLGGLVIWAKELEEQKVTKSKEVDTGKGGRGPTQTDITYNYFLTCAIAFAEGEAKQLLRLWADGKLIYSQRTGEGTGQNAGLSYRFYRGTEDQLPDNLIEEDRGDAPAHRGLCYIVIERLPLQDYGNRPPEFSAEITFADPADDADFFETTILDTADTNGISEGAIAVDYARDRLYVQAFDDSRIRVISLTSMEEVGQLPLTFSIHGCSQVTGKLWGRSGNDDVVVNPFSGQMEVVNTTNNNTTEAVGRYGSTWSLTDDTGTVELACTRSHSFGPGATPTIRFHDLENMAYITTISGPTSPTSEYIKPCVGRAGQGFGFFGWINASQMRIYRLDLLRNYQTGHPLHGVTKPVWPKETLIGTFTPSQIVPGATAFQPYGPDGFAAVCDPVSESYIVQVATDAGDAVVRFANDGTIDWNTPLPNGSVKTAGAENYDGMDRIGGESWAWFEILARTITKVNISSGELDPYFNGVNEQTVSGGLGNEPNWYDDGRNCIFSIANGSADNFYRHRVGVSDLVTAPVSSIITDLALACGLTAGQIDVTDLTQHVAGFMLDDVVPVKAALEPLSDIMLFDVVERDGKIVFRNRGDSPTITLDEDDFVQRSSDRTEQYEETRTQEIELPRTQTIGFIDPDNQYDPGFASYSRISGRAEGKKSVDVSAALFYTDAKQIAEKLNYTAWMERDRYAFRLHQGNLALEPADVVTINLNDGLQFRGRFDEVGIGVDFSMEMGTVKENVGQYVSTTVGDGGAGNNPGVSVIGPTQLFLLDLPLILDTDDTGQNGSRSYWMGAGFNSSTWPGAYLSKSPDGSTWNEVNAQVDDAAWGVSTNALGDPPSLWRFDRENVLTVLMVVGGTELASATELEVCNGANGALLVKGNGEVEVIQFATVTQVGENEFELSDLLRGRRGSDTMAFDHTVNETFILLSNSSLTRFLTPVSGLDVAFRYRATTNGQLFEDSIQQVFTYTGRDLMPYAPTNVVCEDAGGGDVDISWVRRTRIGGGLTDSTGDVPLYEDDELYDLVIYSDATFSTIVRTVSDLTSSDYTYDSADRVTDGTDSDDECYLRIYQKSGLVGRGFTHDWTVEIT